MGTLICQASIEAANGNVTSFTPLNVELLVIFYSPSQNCDGVLAAPLRLSVLMS
jgi:hypothetical protein